MSMRLKADQVRLHPTRQYRERVYDEFVSQISMSLHIGWSGRASWWASLHSHLFPSYLSLFSLSPLSLYLSFLCLCNIAPLSPQLDTVYG